MKKDILPDFFEAQEICNEDLLRHRKYAHLVKESAESVLFIFLANKQFFEYFNHSLLHVILMPILGVALTVDAIIESTAFYRNQNKNFGAIVNLTTTWVAAALVDTVVVGTLALSSFALGPYLFLAALGAMMLRTLTNLSTNIQKYKRETDPNLKKSYAQAAALNLVSAIGISLITVFVIGVMISPIAPMATMGLGIAASLFTVLLVAWKLVPTSFRHSIKSCHSLFKKASYESAVGRESLTPKLT
ncbi:MAG: hypothetical protein A3F10_00300 [Coxiella sp. RIFCSPHIGHO2_12_FULL_42_15]|nr:MAG: hypothetical protein A3F10_00300 [Coxiella sp. RIFCSPHIGHO2_12_FULL_42_15]